MRFLQQLLCLTLVLASAHGQERQRAVDLATRKAEKVESKRFAKPMWTEPKRSALQEKTFPIKEWDRHFSPLGSKRASIRVDETSKKKRFETRVIERKSFKMEMSQWNDRMADLHEKAGIEVDDQAQIAADHKLYHMMLQDTQPYAELGEELSLRDINRFQFRSNRSDGEIPAAAAGSGKDE